MKLTEEQLKELMQQPSVSGRSHCLTQDQFTRAIKGEMTQQERIEMAHHMTECSHCTEEYRTIRSLKPWIEKAQVVAASGHSDSPAHTTVIPIRSTDKNRSVWPGLSAIVSPRSAAFALAASVLIILALGGWLLFNRQEQNSQIARLNEQLEEKNRELSSAQESLEQTRRELEDRVRQMEQKESSEDEKEQAGREEEMARLRRTVKELSSPQLDVPIIDIDPSPVRGGESEKTSQIEVPETAGFLTLILNFSGETHSRYEVEILDQQGKRVWNGQRTRKSEARSLNLTLSRRLVSEGQYLIKLYGLGDSGKELVADYQVTIRYQ